MLINLRNALMAGKRLPYDAEVEYLESTGTQWIDTGYSFNSATDSVELVFELLTTTPNYKWIFGAYDAMGLAIGSGDGNTRRTLRYNASTSYNSSTYYTAGAHIFLADSTGASIDGHNFFAFADFSTTSHILLYSLPIDTSTYCSNSRIWSYKHYRNGVLVRDFIPVRKGTVGHLYDRVTGKLFGNAGTGDFVLGQDVVPVEYLQSTGTQWIATGLGAGWTSSSIKIAATLKFTDLSTGEHDLAGSGNAATPTMGRNGSNYFMWAKGGTTWYPTGCDTNWHKVSYTFNNPSGRVFELDGALYSGTQDNTFATGDGIHIFASGPNRYPLNCQLAKLEIWQNGVLVRKFLSVRVGTEGAMMDVLTRRIYRNAGTGAFTYGNDLKYPIPA